MRKRPGGLAWMVCVALSIGLCGVAEAQEAESPASAETRPAAETAAAPEASEGVKKRARDPDENQREPRQKVKAGASVAFPVDI